MRVPRPLAPKSSALIGCASLTLLASCLDFDRYGEGPSEGGAPPASGGSPAAGAPGVGAGTADGGSDGGTGQGGEGGTPMPAECGDGVVAPSEECEDSLGPEGACVGCVVVCDGPDETKIAKHCYWLDFNGNRTWDEAKGDCEGWRQGAHLAAIEKQAEQTALEPLFDNDTIWLGGRDEEMDGTWTWITGEAFTFDNWDVAQGQPNQGNNERCMGIYDDSTNGTSWHDIDCGFHEKYLCEWDPPKQ